MPILRIACALSLALLVASAGAALATSDPLRAEQWALDMIRSPQAWQQATGQGVVVAVIDTGIDLNHPDLAPRLLRDSSGGVVGRDFVSGGLPQDEHGHGTLVAGIIGAETDNGIGIAAVAPQVRLMPVRVLDANGAGRGSDVDAGIRWAADNGAHVINVSIESLLPLPGQLLPSAPVAAVRYAWERGAVVVAAAGNSSTPFTDYPASSPVLLVGATDQQDRRATFSDSGHREMVWAPGVDIISTHCSPCGAGSRPEYARGSGTSFAAPHAAGTVALLRGLGLDHRQASAVIRETSVDFDRRSIGFPTGHGRIDAAAAVAAVTGATSAPPPAPATPPADDSAAGSGSPPPSDAPAPPAGQEDRPAPAEDQTDRPEADDQDDSDPPDGPDNGVGTQLDDAGPDDGDDPDGDGISSGSADLGAVEIPTDRGRDVPLPLALLAGALVVGAGAAVTVATRNQAL